MKSKKKSNKRTHKLRWTLSIIVIFLVALLGGTGVSIVVNNQGEVIVEATGVTNVIELSEDQIPAVVEDDLGEFIEIEEIDGEEIKTVEEVDGGQFEDADTGVSILEGEYEDLGAVIETFDTSTPEAFKNATLGKCIYANNRFGAQCISIARSYWFSYAGRDVSTCGTGMAKGMMNCADQNAGDDFVVFWGNDNIQAGDWLVFDGGQYGHVGMALGPVKNGYVALLGENQGGHLCGQGIGGSATNIINISIKNLIGGYRPKAYIVPEPTPEPTNDYHIVVKGETLGGIARSEGWYTGTKLFGDDGYAQELAEFNGIENRGLIYPNQIIKRK